MSGSNQFHGTLFEFDRNSFFDARNYFDHTVGPLPFKRNQFGGSAGGPIKRDKTFIFGSYEAFRQRLAVSEVAIVPDLNARNGYLPNASGTLVNIGLAAGVAPYFALWPAPNGPELGGGAAYYYANPEQMIREDFGNLRVDHNFTTNDFFSGVYTVDDGFNHNPGSTSLQLTVSNMRSQIASLQETHTFSSSVINTLRGGFTRAKWMMTGAPPSGDSSLAFVQGQPIGNINIGSVGNGQLGAIAGAGSNGSQQFDDIARNLFTVTDSVSFVKGVHKIQVGGWFQKVESNDNAADQRNGVASFTDLQHFMLGQATQVVATLNPIEIGWRQTAGAWYAEDSIQIRPNLTLTLGIRHEFNNGWNSPKGLAANFVPNSNYVLQTQPVVGDSVYSENNAKFMIGPRAGLAWSPFGNQHTAIHAGYGLYYEQLDYMGNCCDSIPIGIYDSRVTVSPATFPLLISPTQKLAGSKIGPTGVEPYLKMPAVFQYNLRIDQALAANTLLSVGYVGERGYHLLATADANTAYPSIVNGADYFAPKSPRMNPSLSNARYTVSNGASNYNALQTDLTHRFSHGIQFRANYTFSKSLDNHSSSFLSNNGMGGTTTYLDPFDPHMDWGPSNFNITSRVAGNFGYALPVGKGKSVSRRRQRRNERDSGRVANQRYHHRSDRIPVHAAGRIQSVRRRRHTKPGPRLAEPEFPRPDRRGQPDTSGSTRRPSCSRGRYVRQCGQRHSDGAGPGEHRWFHVQDLPRSASVRRCNSAPKSSTPSITRTSDGRSSPRSLLGQRLFVQRRGHYFHLDHVPANAVRTETRLVGSFQQMGGCASACRPVADATKQSPLGWRPPRDGGRSAALKLPKYEESWFP